MIRTYRSDTSHGRTVHGNATTETKLSVGTIYIVRSITVVVRTVCRMSHHGDVEKVEDNSGRRWYGWQNLLAVCLH